MRETEKDHILFESTGRSVYTFGAVLGLNPFHPGEVHYGWDGTLDECETSLSPAERVELADAMIAAWTRYREEAQTGGQP